MDLCDIEKIIRSLERGQPVDQNLVRRVRQIIDREKEILVARSERTKKNFGG